jgi:SAM-dependent methyltransferase
MSNALTPEKHEALVEWARRVRANNEQVEQYREAPERADFYGPVASSFKADPRRLDDPVVGIIQALIQPDETWLDIGAGGGRYALPIALNAREVIAVEPSGGMLTVLRESMSEYDIHNVRIVESRWPMESNPPIADVAFISHVGYDIADIDPFLDAMEASARRLCVAVFLAKPPASVADSFWPLVHGVERVSLPALPEFLALQLARGRLFEVRLTHRQPMTYGSTEEAGRFLRQQLWVEPESEKDRKLQALITESVKERGGRYTANWEETPIGVVSWKPPAG